MPNCAPETTLLLQPCFAPSSGPAHFCSAMQVGAGNSDVAITLALACVLSASQTRLYEPACEERDYKGLHAFPSDNYKG